MGRTADVVFADMEGANGCTGFGGRLCIGYAGVAKAGEDEKS